MLFLVSVCQYLIRWTKFGKTYKKTYEQNLWTKFGLQQLTKLMNKIWLYQTSLESAIIEYKITLLCLFSYWENSDNFD